MRKIITVLALVSCTCSHVRAQKLFATKAANVKFYSKTPAEDIEAANNQVESKLTDKGQILFSLLIKGFKFENDLMQEHFNGKDWMDSDKFPKAEFKGIITNVAAVNFAKDGNYPVMVDGILTIRGIAKKTQAAGLITIAGSKISCKSIFKLKVKDFGISGKDIGSSIANELEITVNAKYN